LATQLKTEVVSTVKAILENALQEEVTAFLQGIDVQKTHRSGFYHRALTTQYGQIPDLSVPILWERNAERIVF
jgi:transposase-like protein